MYLGGGIHQSDPGASDQPTAPNYIHIYDFQLNEWDGCLVPASYSALTTYKEQLVLLGGKDLSTEKITGHVWSLQRGQKSWMEIIPPMHVACWRASAVSLYDRLFVAGGMSETLPLELFNTVQVYNGQQWVLADPLPIGLSNAQSTLLDGNWYMTGGYGQGNGVLYTSLESLLASTQFDIPTRTQLWKEFPNVPYQHSNIVTHGKQLIAIGKPTTMHSSIVHVYSPNLQSWEKVADLPTNCHSTYAVMLPTGELLIGDSQHALRGSFRSKYILPCMEANVCRTTLH